MTECENFGRNLRCARRRRGFSQRHCCEEFERQTGLCHIDVSLIERGLVDVTLYEMVVLAELVGQPVTALLKWPTRAQPSEVLEMR